MNYDYPGNIRELEHVIERAIIFAEGDLITTEDLNLPSSAGRTIPKVVELIKMMTAILSMDEVEKRHIAKALISIDGIDPRQLPDWG
jgi:DNA-binding NtrC family response regulator